MKRAAAIVLNKHSRIIPACGMDVGLTICHCTQLAGYEMSKCFRPEKIIWHETENRRKKQV
jgi:hypothetical protein